ncbi:TIGR02391 family protein [Nocardia tengchongensis]
MQLDRVDTEWVKATLENFLDEAQAVKREDAVYFSVPGCGRDRAIELLETVLPVLQRLYPDWRSENGGSHYDEFRGQRDAVKRLLARLALHEQVQAKLGGDASPRIPASGLHPLIWAVASAQWSTGHRHEAVLAAAKAVNSHLQTRLGRRDLSETDLVKQAFSDKAPEVGKPRLRYNGIPDDKIRSSMRQGVMDFGSGCFAAIRNPIGHRQNGEIELTEQTAL